MGAISSDETPVTAVCNLAVAKDPPPGQTKVNCSRCRRRVWISTVTLFQLGKREHTILCVSCARKQIGRIMPMDRLP